MKVFIRSGNIKCCVLLALIVVVGSVSAESESYKKPAEKEVLTTLEQRMVKRISVDFRDTPIDDVIRIIADQADVDIIKSPSVTGKVTATLTNVPLEEALNNILAAHGYAYVASRNMIRVAPAEEIDQSSERLVNRIYRITYASIKEVETALEKFISGHGSLSSNPGTSNIIVTDTESKIKAIDTFINEIDRITPQILVEARIYDITSKDRLDLGVEWQAGRNTIFADSTGSSVATGTGALGSNPSKDRDPFITGIFGGDTGKALTATGALRFGWLNSGIDIDMLIKAQQDIIDAKLLANPRILVLDNETAMIKIVSEIPFQELTESSDGGTVGSTSFREVGVELEVTPHLARDEMIRLNLKPEFSVKTEDVTLGTGQSNLFDQPIVDRREADTTLLIRNGQTAVLGGLRKKQVSKQTSKIPLLADIPLVGALFKFEGEDTVNSEMVVFVTPWIVKQPALTPLEELQFQETEFEGPSPVDSRAETAKK